MRFRLRTLMIATAVGPPLLAGLWYAWPIGLLALGFTAAVLIPLGLYAWLE